MKRAAVVAGVSAVAMICVWAASANAAPASAQSAPASTQSASPRGFGIFRSLQTEAPPKKPENKSKPADAKSSDTKPPKAALHEADRIPPIPKGPLHVIVSLDRQRATLYADGQVVAQSRISSGTATHPTPLGVFSILQKNRHHVSNLYDAKMPYMQRITWSGAALHEGPLPGYPASHGCVRLPTEFAQFLWKVTRIGARVIITRDEPTPVAIEHERLFVAKARTEEPKIEPKAVPKIDPAPAVTPKTEPKPEPRLDIISERKSAPSRDGETIATRTIAMVKTADATATLRGPLQPDVVVKPLAPDLARSTPAGEQPTKLPLHGDTDEIAMPRGPATTAAGRLAETVVVERAAPVDAMAKADVIRIDAIRTDLIKTGLVRQDRIAAPAVTVAAAAAPVPAAPVAAAVAAAEPPRRKGLVSVFVSLKDSRLYVRQGMEPLFDAPVTIARPTEPIGTHVYTATGSKPDGSGMRWNVVSIPSSHKPAPEPKTSNSGKKPRNDKPAVKAVELIPAPVLDPRAALDRIVMPPDAVQHIATLVTPGASLIVSDNKLSGETGATTDFIVETR
jgi:lipoprotein-anchoring transpeptidase ErfK/SrfK